MPHSIEAMKVALRVLAAIIEKKSPEAADVKELRRLSLGRVDLGIDVDEMACEVIKEALKQRAESREKSRSAGRH